MANSESASDLEWVKPRKPASVPAPAANEEEAMSKAEMEWVELNQQLARMKKMDGSNEYQETQKQKIQRKLMENPFVPIGALMTTGCLFMGLYKFVRKDMAGSQTMMRGRIAAQGMTVIACMIGVTLEFKKGMQRKLEKARENKD
eukprot:TRINITY_DN9758_c0_g1_i1.p1 TRINITY_DN9758_c0_g1~~TRINITY_DN9758_c0_g1_i1.p1  ORF type:complete len:145 (+),score=44.23 TRINITY_DN9758_c0_g1_i1:30-464(+)